MRVKEVRISDTDRFVICHNPEAAEHDRHMREQLVAQLADLITDTDKLSDFKRGELRGLITETTAGGTWPRIRRELDRLHLGTFTGPTGTYQQATALTIPQRDLLAKLEIPIPKQVVTLQPALR
ncbi:hypothetical protein ABZ251_37890 [Streptomyces chartreusis]